MIVLKKHQNEGVTRLINEPSGSLILGDAMGTGKTILSLAYGKWLYHSKYITNILVICPAHLLARWEEGIVEYYGFKPRVHHGTNRNKPGRVASPITITSYETFVRDSAILSQLFPPANTLLVVDEAHYIKNKDKARTKAILEFGAAFRLPMTGTPIANKPEDLFALITFVNPHLTRNDWDWWSDTFLVRKSRNIQFKKGGSRWISEIVGYKNHEMLNNILKSCMIRRRLQDCADLPRKQVIYIPYNPAATLYQNVLDQTEINDDSILTRVQQLLQALSGVDPFTDSRPWTPCPKLAVLESIIESAGSHTIIWFKFVNSLIPVMEYFKAKGYNVHHHTGEDTPNQRGVQLHHWRKQGGLLFATIKSAGTGLNLTEATTAAFYETELSPAENDQAEDRIYRIGQDKPVVMYYMYGQNTVEQGVIELLKRKSHTNKAVVDTVPQQDLQYISKYSYRIKLNG